MSLGAHAGSEDEVDPLFHMLQLREAAVAEEKTTTLATASKETEPSCAIESVRNNDSMTTGLQWHKRGVDDSLVSELASALRGNTHLKRIDISRNRKIGHVGAVALIENLGKSCVEWVELKRTSVSPEHQQHIGQICRCNTIDLVAAPGSTIEAVEWARCNVEDTDVVSLCKVLHLQSTVSRINLEHNPQVGTQSAAALESMLAGSAVEWVGLSFTGVSNEAKHRIRAVCFRNSITYKDTLRRVQANEEGLIQIDWQDMDADDTAIRALAAPHVLGNNSHVLELDLRDNPLISDEGLVALEAVLEGGNVQSVRLSRTGASSRMVEKIKRVAYRTKIKNSLFKSNATRPNT